MFTCVLSWKESDSEMSLWCISITIGLTIDTRSISSRSAWQTKKKREEKRTRHSERSAWVNLITSVSFSSFFARWRKESEKEEWEREKKSSTQIYICGNVRRSELLNSRRSLIASVFSFSLYWILDCWSFSSRARSISHESIKTRDDWKWDYFWQTTQGSFQE